jgi:hypothetical protein
MGARHCALHGHSRGRSSRRARAGGRRARLAAGSALEGAQGQAMSDQTTREHLEHLLRRLKGARAAAAELSLKPKSGGLELLASTHLAVLALEAALAEGIEPEHSALAEVMADLRGREPAPPRAGEPGAADPAAGAPTVADWWRAVAPLGVLSWTGPARRPR